MNISVAICTYNRAERLRTTLESLRRVKIPAGVTWEVVVVDNNSTDATAAVVETFRPHLPVTYCFEREQGKGFAYRCAVAATKGELLVFTDDDVVLEETWLEEMWQGAERNSDAGFFGGKVLPIWENSRPGWFVFSAVPGLKSVITYEDSGEKELRYTHDHVAVGPNMAFRRWVFEKVGGFRLDLGPRGKGGLRGDETEFCQRLISAGIVGVYLPRSIVHHLVPRQNCSKKYVWNWFCREGRTQVRLSGRLQCTRSIAGVPGWVLLRLVKESAGLMAATIAWREVSQVHWLARLGRTWGMACASFELGRSSTH